MSISFSALLKEYRSGNKRVMGKFFPIIRDMLILARSYTSRLKHSGRPDGVLDLSRYIKGHTFYTLRLNFKPNSGEETDSVSALVVCARL